jgi:flagellar biosynthesis protein FlhB
VIGSELLLLILLLSLVDSVLGWCSQLLLKSEKMDVDDEKVFVGVVLAVVVAVLVVVRLVTVVGVSSHGAPLSTLDTDESSCLNSPNSCLHKSSCSSNSFFFVNIS